METVQSGYSWEENGGQEVEQISGWDEHPVTLRPRISPVYTSGWRSWFPDPVEYTNIDDVTKDTKQDDDDDKMEVGEEKSPSCAIYCFILAKSIPWFWSVSLFTLDNIWNKGCLSLIVRV